MLWIRKHCLAPVWRGELLVVGYPKPRFLYQQQEPDCQSTVATSVLSEVRIPAGRWWGGRRAADSQSSEQLPNIVAKIDEFVRSTLKCRAGLLWSYQRPCGTHRGPETKLELFEHSDNAPD